MATQVHKRKLIRAAAVAQLTGRTSAGDRIAQQRVNPWRAKDLPGILVYVHDEDVDRNQTRRGPREIMRRARLVFEGYVQAAAATVDDDLDAFALEIEQAIYLDPTLGQLLYDMTFLGTAIEFSEDGVQPIASVRLIFEAAYETVMEPDEDDTVVDLETIGSQFNRNDAQAEPERIHDELTLETES